MEKIAFFGLCGAMLCVVLKKYNSDYAIMLSMFCGCAILLISCEYVLPVISVVNEYIHLADIPSYHMGIIFKSVACAYLAQFACDVCRDAGEHSIAAKIESSAKIIIAYMALPVIINLFEYLLDML